MPTTYTNGLKLPDLGSIDWFNAYKNNIDILDPIVGTVNGVATTYAPISHNHSASEITSGTIDIARLPPAALERLTTVADQTARYALTTSTVQLGDTVKQLDTGIMYLVVDTTKLNSADGYVEYSAGTASKAIADEDGTSIKTGYGKLAGNQTWTGENSFSKAIKVNGARTAYILPESAASYSGMSLLTYGFSGALKIGTYTLDANNNPSLDTSAGYISVSTGVLNSVNTVRLEPKNSTTADLGTSSYQWSSVYAQNYYYNGTAWGLDKANVWTGTQQFNNSNIICKNGLKEIGSANSGGHFTINFFDKNDHMMGWVQHLTEFTRIGCKNKFTDGVLDPNGSELQNYLSVYVKSNGTKYVGFISDAIPEINNGYNLGTSTNKWKTLNGINPGALSLPNGNAQDTSWIGDLTIKDGSGYNLKTFTLNGWITINIPNTAGNLVVVNNGCGQIVTNEAKGVIGSNCSVFIPVVANVQISILLVLQTGESVKNAIFVPCLGNV